MTIMKNKQHLFRSRAAGLAFGLGVSAIAQLAGASSEFPTELREIAAMDCKPACTVCHTTNPGALGTANQPFADAMQDAGLVAGDVDSVALAYMALDDTLDSDGDGATDKAELEAEGASDPNVAGAGFPCDAEVRYGCGVHAQPTPRASHPLAWLWLLALGAGALVGRRFLAFSRRER